MINNKRLSITAQLTLFGLISVVTIFGAGEVDTSFNAAAYGMTNGVVKVIKKQPDGKVLVGGSFNLIGGTTKSGLARFNSNGSLDTTFNPSINNAITGNFGVWDIYL